MYVLVTDGSITKTISGNRGITIGDVQYPQNIFTLWSASEKEAIGIYEVVFDNTNKKDETYYTNTNQSFAFADGVVTASYGSATAKAHADRNATDGDGVELDPVVVIPGLKTIKIKNIKEKAATILSETDWYIVRKADAGTAVPSAITNHRAAVRTKCAEMETAITNASNTPAIETLYTYVNTADEGDPEVIERPLGEFPVLGS
jgi:hypothetical protein